MGKKKKSEEKRGRAQEKAAHKADKKQKSKKGEGEEDFDAILEEIRQLDLKQTAVTETKCPAPSPRCFGSLVAHPEKQELLLFGGEFFDGKLTRCYNDLFIYNIRPNEWSRWQIPNPPPPRSSHQAVCVPQGGGQMWLFGGEFTSANNESFHHFKDLWMLDLAKSKWETVKAAGGPSSRSGHRMVVANKHLVVFGGFHEGHRDFLYFNDVFAFSLQARAWHRITVAGGPSPRSAVSLSTTPQGALLVMGGYSRLKMKRDGVQKSVVHSDAWSLVPLDAPGSADAQKASAGTSSAAGGKKTASKKSDSTSRWKWVKINPTGRGPGARSGAAMVQLSEQRAVLFGGAEDEEEDDKLQSQFLADVYQLATDGKPPRWFEVNVDELSRQTEGGPSKARRRRKKKSAAVAADGEGDSSVAATENCDDENDGSDSEYETESEEEEEEEKGGGQGKEEESNDRAGVGDGATAVTGTVTTENEPDASATGDGGVTVHSDTVFTCVMTTTTSTQASSVRSKTQENDSASATAAADTVEPIGRISAALAAKGGTVFVYGGLNEQGDRQVYLDDMYSLDVVRRSGTVGGWKCLVPLRSDAIPWLEEEEDEDDEDEDEEGEEEEEEEGDGDQEDDGQAAAATCGKAVADDNGDDEESDDVDDDDSDDVIEVNAGESMGEFYIRTKGEWLAKAEKTFEADHAGDDVGDEERDRSIKALAFQLAKAAHKAAPS